MSRKPPLNWIRSFDSATRHASFTRAAQELSITQAAVSKQIRALEDLLNCRLFHRHAHGLELTEQGRRYWRDTHDLVQQLDQVTAQFINQRQEHKIHLRCNISYSALVLVEQLRGFTELNPGISIKLAHEIWESDTPGHNAHIEIGYCALQGFSGNEYRHLLSAGSLFPVVAPGMSAEKIAQLPLIHVAGYYQEWNSWIERADQAELDGGVCDALQLHQRNKGRNDWFVDNSLIACQLAAQGQGIALGRDCLVRRMLTEQQLVRACGDYSLPAGEGFVINLTAQGREHENARTLFGYLVDSCPITPIH
jgi:LysR family glycine cleavage system transcriptional activator